LRFRKSGKPSEIASKLSLLGFRRQEGCWAILVGIFPRIHKNLSVVVVLIIGRYDEWEEWKGCIWQERVGAVFIMFIFLASEECLKLSNAVGEARYLPFNGDGRGDSQIKFTLVELSSLGQAAFIPKDAI
jgi:hypothetical protein